MQNREPKSEFIDKSKEPAKETEIKAIAFYLPQFHPTNINDENWGKGFSEWRNVTRAVPQFKGHYQPRLPRDLGFYDLRLKDTQSEQIEMAKHYGIYGFCFYYYWFNGKKILDKPLKNILENKDLNIPFCLCWANENWTKKWDGKNHDVILEQSYSPDDDLKFIHSISLYLLDKRYIRIQNKALIIIYRPELLPDVYKTIKIWKNYAKENDLGELMVIGTTTSLKDKKIKSLGLDGIVQFPPNTVHNQNVAFLHKFYNKNFSGKVYDYKDSSEKCLNQLDEFKNIFPGIMMAWDNEPRMPGKSTIFTNCNPDNYGNWLSKTCEYIMNDSSNEENLLFINAWNEWAEGTYLEPDMKYGYAYLEKTKIILNNYPRITTRNFNCIEDKE